MSYLYSITNNNQIIWIIKTLPDKELHNILTYLGKSCYTSMLILNKCMFPEVLDRLLPYQVAHNLAYILIVAYHLYTMYCFQLWKQCIAYQ